MSHFYLFVFMYCPHVFNICIMLFAPQYCSTPPRVLAISNDIQMSSLLSHPARVSFNFSLALGIFFSVPHGHIIQYFPVQALYPEPCTRPYGKRIYRHSSALRALTAGRFRPTRPATELESLEDFF
jgi:hypothetical protein